MEKFENEIQDQNNSRKLNILKGFAEVEEIQNIQKAKVVGQTKVGADGITRVWVERDNGTFGWRRQKGTQSGNNDGKKPEDIQNKKNEEYHKKQGGLGKPEKKTNNGINPNRKLRKINPEKELNSLKKNLKILQSQSYVEQRKPEKKAKMESLQNQINEIEKKSIENDKIQPKGITLADAVSYGEKLLKSGLSASEVRRKIELHFPSFKNSLNGVMSSIINNKDSNKETSKLDNSSKEIKNKTVNQTVQRYLKIKKDVKEVSHEGSKIKTFSYIDTGESEWFSKPNETMKSFIERIEPDVKLENGKSNDIKKAIEILNL